HDIGRDYQAVIRVNSQSGKGGMAFLLERDYGINLPRWMMLALAPYVQQESERRASELSSDMIRQVMFDNFTQEAPLSLVDYQLSKGQYEGLEITLQQGDKTLRLSGKGNGAMSAFTDAWQRHSGSNVGIIDYSEHSLGASSEANAIAFVQLNIDGQRLCAVAEDSDTVSASLKALLSGINLAEKQVSQARQPNTAELAL
ncbi:MAG: 2-isopropylmalate synthase, partial [Halomonas sp.]